MKVPKFIIKKFNRDKIIFEGDFGKLSENQQSKVYDLIDAGHMDIYLDDMLIVT